jgi:hypothetical protein
MPNIPNVTGIYDDANYLHHPVITVTGQRWFRLLPKFSSELLMIKWWPLGSIRPQTLTGTMRLSAIAGVGNLRPKDINLDIDKSKFAQFITPAFNGLEYSIELQQKTPATQIKISEYLYPISYLNNHQHPQMIGYPPDTGRSNGSSQAIATVPANIAAVQLLPANALRAPDGIIKNYSNKKLYVSFSSTQMPTVSTDYDFAPASSGGEPGLLQIPADYEGEIWGIWAGSAPTGNAKITHFTYNS